MVRGLLHLVLLVLCRILTTSSGINIMKNRPYGPLMCLQECGDSGDSLVLVKGYHCHRITKKDPQTFQIIPSGDIFLCSGSSRMTNAGTYSKRLPGEDRLSITVKDTFRLRTNATSKSTLKKSEKALKCSNNKLHRACKTGTLTEVRRFLSAGYNINCRGRSGRTPVMAAAAYRQVAVFNFLVSQGCDISVVDNQNNMLIHEACFGGNIGIVKTVLDLDKYQLESRGHNNMTPVMTAACYCKKDVVDFLRWKHCNMSAVFGRGQTILHVASHCGCTDVVDYILSEHIHDIESRDEGGWTPLMIAAYSCKREVFVFLLTKGCNVTEYDNNGHNILHLACQTNCTVVVDHILSEDILNRESRDVRGQTSLLVAAFLGNVKMVRFLLNKGCSLNAVDENFNNILHVACSGGNINMVKYLLTLKDVDVHKTNRYGKTPLQTAERRNMKTIVDILKAKLIT